MREGEGNDGHRPASSKGEKRKESRPFVQARPEEKGFSFLSPTLANACLKKEETRPWRGEKERRRVICAPEIGVKGYISLSEFQKGSREKKERKELIVRGRGGEGEASCLPHREGTCLPFLYHDRDDYTGQERESSCFRRGGEGEEEKGTPPLLPLVREETFFISLFQKETEERGGRVAVSQRRGGKKKEALTFRRKRRKRASSTLLGVLRGIERKKGKKKRGRSAAGEEGEKMKRREGSALLAASPRGE